MRRMSRNQRMGLQARSNSMNGPVTTYRIGEPCPLLPDRLQTTKKKTREVAKLYAAQNTTPDAEAGL